MFALIVCIEYKGDYIQSPACPDHGLARGEGEEVGDRGEQEARGGRRSREEEAEGRLEARVEEGRHQGLGQHWVAAQVQGGPRGSS